MQLFPFSMVLIFLLTILNSPLASAYGGNQTKTKKSTDPSSPLTAKASAPLVVDGITYRILEKSAEKPSKLELKHVEFFGTNSLAIARLNQAVKKIWRDEQGCGVEEKGKEDAEPGSVNRELSVKLLNGKVAVLSDSVDAFCPGNAHPENYTREHIIDISSGEEVDFFKRLPLASKEKIFSRISNMGLKVRDDEACKSEYQLSSLRQNEIRFSIENAQVFLTPNFRHAVQACEEGLTLSIEDFKKYFKGDIKALEILDALK